MPVEGSATATYQHLTEEGKKSPAEEYEIALKTKLEGALTGQKTYTLKTFGGKEVWGTEEDLDENAYGAAAVAIVKDTTKLYQQIQDKTPWSGLALTASRLAFSLGIMTTNLIFQGLILWYCWIFVAQPSVRNVQTLYADFHAHNFDENGELIPEAWDTYPSKQEVCQITMSSRGFYFGILTLWALLMMQELRSVYRVAMDVWGVRRVESVSEMIEYPNTGDYELGGRCLIVGLTPLTRTLLLTTVCIPRAIIGVVLFLLGCQWLSSSASFADMTLNAMALEFVKNIDEILYDSILPRQLKNEIADTNVFKIEDQKTLEKMNAGEWTGYKRTVCWLGGMTVFLILYGAVLQTVLPFDLSELMNHCQEQILESQTPLCSKFTWSGWSEECYPYGKTIEN